jgi:cytoskeletal protein CcmA (bactofilin family)
MRRFVIAALAGLMLAGLAPPAARAADWNDGKDRVVITGDVFLERHEEADTIAVIDGDVEVRGTVHDDVFNLTGHTRVSGHVEGDVISITDRATVLPGGRVDGDVIYVEEKPNIDPGSQVGGDVRRLKASEWASPLHLALASLAIWLAMTISSLLLGLALVWLAPRALDAAYAVAGPFVGQSIAAGLGILIGLPIVAVILVATLVGLPLGLALLLVMLPLMAVGYTTSAWLLGRRVAGPPRGRVISFLAGWGILRAIALVPVLGSIVWLGAAVFGMGTLAVAAWRARSSPPAEPGPTPAPSTA